MERDEYIAAKEKLDVTKVSDLDELKKLLMRRAIQTIPLLLSLQNEGSSIDRLYKKGMLTDDMHFKVKELKAFVDKEFQDIQFEADDLMEGWGQHIWPQAMQFHQMIQKQAEAKVEEQRAVEEEKKKVRCASLIFRQSYTFQRSHFITYYFAPQSKKAAKKQVTADEDAPSSDPVAPSSSASSATPAASSSTSAPSSSSAAAGTSSATKKAARVPRVIRPVDPDEIKIQDAERMAQQLLEVNTCFFRASLLIWLILIVFFVVGGGA